jgi:hypothetical protein
MQIKSGTTRIVFVFQKFVIKIPNFQNGWKYILTGLIANLNENLWSSFNYITCIARVKYCFPGGFLLIMEKASNVGEIQVNFEDFKEIPLDKNLQNFGIINNKIVCIDYGSNIDSIICPKCNKFWDEII